MAVIPARNAAGTVGAVVAGSLRHCGRVVVGDDASGDGTAEAALRAGARVVILPGHQGKGQVLRRLLDEALAMGAESVITLDADSQHDPADIPKFLEAAAAHPGAVLVGDRLAGGGAIPCERLLALRAASAFVRHAAGLRLADTQCGFRLIPRELAKRCRTQAPRFAMETEFLFSAAAAGAEIVPVPVAARYGGEVPCSQFRPAKDFLSIASVVWGCIAWRCALGLAGAPSPLEEAVRRAGGARVRGLLLALAPLLVPAVCAAAWLFPARAGVFGGTRAGATAFALDCLRLAAALAVLPFSTRAAAAVMALGNHPRHASGPTGVKKCL